MNDAPLRRAAGRLRGCLILAVAALTGCGEPEPPPPAEPGSFAFAVIGDAPYHGLDFPRYRNALEDIDRADLAFVVHVGDILWYPCSAKAFNRRLREFRAVAHPLIYTPGDNEWADCHERRAGGFAPLGRLALLRETFFADPHRSLGARPLRLETQADDPDRAEFVENARWIYRDVVFVTVNMPGSWNAGSVFAGRSEADDEDVGRRTRAAVEWIGAAFALADRVAARAVVIATHADMTLDAPADDAYRSSYEPLPAHLERLVADSVRPVLLIHGDSHEYTVDRPLRDRVSGSILARLTRLQTMGSPDIGWVHVTVSGARPARFAFEPRLAAWWPFW